MNKFFDKRVAHNIAALIPAKTPANQLITDILPCAMVQYSLCHLDLKVMILNTLRKRMILSKTTDTLKLKWKMFVYLLTYICSCITLVTPR